MPGSAPLLKRRPEWTALAEHYAKIKDVHLRTLFAENPQRGERLTAEGAGLYLDYSKHRITDETLRLLLALAEAVNLRGRIDAMFRGDKINSRKTGRCSTSPCARPPVSPSSWTV